MGWLRIITTEDAVKEVWLVEEKANDATENNPLVMQQTQLELTEFLDGTRQHFTVALAPEGTAFQQTVWAELVKIPFGKTISYSELAKRLGDEKVIRAAASANGKNPIGLLIPCHRVIGTDGKLVGYAGGLARKQWLLAHENRIANGVLELF